MDLKIDLTLIKNRWYMAVKTKGYKSTAVLNKLISSLFPDRKHFVVRFTDKKTDNSLFKAIINNEIDAETCTSTLSIYNMNGDLVSQHEQCTNLIKDFNIPNEFYINYNKEW